jgi:hypothetical protein
MVQTKQQLVTSTKLVYAGKNPLDYITVHETANTSKGAGAQAHANLQSKGNVRNASWQWTVDDTWAIQSYRNDQRCWHAGDGRGPGNYSSVGIEITCNPDSDFVTAVHNAAWLTQVLMREGDVPIERVVQHNNWSRKNCPTRLRSGSHGITWDEFIGLVRGAPITPPTPLPPAPVPPTPILRLKVDGEWGSKTTGWMQDIADTPVDGIISHQYWSEANRYLYAAQFDKTLLGSSHARWQQTRLRDLGKYGGKIDGLIGKVHITALQHYYGTPADGYISETDSTLVKAIQNEINNGSFLGIRG